MNESDNDLIAALGRFAADLEAGRLERWRGRIGTMIVIDEPCPSCGGVLVRSGRWGTCCTRPGCRYSWEPTWRPGGGKGTP